MDVRDDITLPRNSAPAEKPDFIARYFLRRLAIAYRESPHDCKSIRADFDAVTRYGEGSRDYRTRRRSLNRRGHFK
jgi:hypothetical protein